MDSRLRENDVIPAQAGIHVVCRNPVQARKDAATRAQILTALESKLRSDGPKSVVVNKGSRGLKLMPLTV